MQPEAPEIGIREFAPGDEAFVYETWLKGAKRACYDFKRVRDSVYYPRQHDVVERALNRSRVLVAHPAGDPDTILGYVVAEPTRTPAVIHWCFVRLVWRRFGIASRLIEAAVPDPNRCAFTYWTVWSLAVPAPRGINRENRLAMRDGKLQAVREAERTGQSGGDTDDLLRRWPQMIYDPFLRG